MLWTLGTLEPRRLLAGVTLLAHGNGGDINGWVNAAAENIAERAGGADHASIYTMSITATAGALSVSGFGPVAGQKDFRTTLGGEVIIQLDWSTVSSGSYSTVQVAQVVSTYLLTNHGDAPALAQLPLHLIGHSRVASLVTTLSQNLGKAGVWVDQLTSLDPHPVDGVNDFLGANFGDDPMASYDNVAFADDYWRSDGDVNNFDFDGEPVAGAHQGNLNNSVQLSYIGSAHIAVTAYYVGTIDTDTNSGGDHPVLNGWYGTTADKPARDATGYAFSRLGNLARPSDGVSSLLGGSAPRTSAGQSGSQWANGFGITASASTVAAGAVVDVSVKFVDRDSDARVAIYLDQDRNPYDGAGRLTSKAFSSASLANARLSVPTAGLRPGSYYLASLTTDSAGHARWSYTDSKITITAPTFATLTGDLLTLTATSGADKIAIYPSGDTIIARLNGVTLSYPRSSVGRIEVYALEGHDSVDLSALQIAAYVNGGPGMDNIVGGSGNDTLSGGAQSNTIDGRNGEDVINGSAGYDLLIGGGGNDRIYGNGGLDTLNGGGNVDRLFGSDSDELFIGGGSNDKIYAYGGNDTLYGNAGADILDGGDGTDTADTDPADIRVSIEVLT